MLDHLLAAAGGREAWKSAGGIGWEVLETLHVQTDRAADQWRVHSRVPRLARFDQGGNGYLYSEYVEFDPKAGASGPLYRRDVRVADEAWGEQQGGHDRSSAAARRAEGLVLREFFLGAMPFSLEPLGARLAPDGTTEIGGHTLGRYTLELAIPVRMEETELVRRFSLLVDPAGPRVARLEYELVAEDRDDFSAAVTRAAVEFEGELAAGALKLPRRRTLVHPGGPRRLELAGEDGRAAPLPAEALARPWASGSIYAVPERADAWDPPRSPAPGGAEPGGTGGG